MYTILRDAYDLTVTTSDPGALEAYDQGVQGLLGWDRRTTDFFRQALAQEPDFALAHASLAVSLFGEEQFSEARAAMQRARALAPRTSPREQSYIDAVGHYVDVRMDDAESALREHLAAYPTDLAVAQRLYLLWFFEGRFEEMLALTTTLRARLPERSFILGLHAFALEELGRCGEALDAAEASIERNPADVWGVHALTHTLYETGEWAEGLQRVPRALAACPEINSYRGHMLWHLILMHLSTGDYARASQMTHDVFERKPSSRGLDFRNSVSVLWRFELCGMDVTARWAPFVEIARRSLNRRENMMFHHAHLAMPLAGGGDWNSAAVHLSLLRARLPSDPTARVVVPIVEGLHAFARGEWRRVIDALEPIRSEIIQIGGSRTQRDVFHDTLLEACFRAGDTERAERFLAERLARRPDHFWVTRGNAAVWSGDGDALPSLANETTAPVEPP